MQQEMQSLIGEFAANRSEKPGSETANGLAKRWQSFLCENCYDCSDEMLCSLAEIYVGDERFMKNIDAAGEGTAQFMHDALKAFCESKKA